MFDFLKKSRTAGAPRKSAGSGRDIEIVAIDQWNITFRTAALWPPREVLLLSLNRPDAVEEPSAAIEVYIQSARVGAGDLNEYTGQVRHAPPVVARWFPRPGSEAQPPQAPVAAVSELRRGRRAVRSFQVMSKDLQRFKALCGDISNSGMRLIAGEQLEVGRELELDLDFDDFRFPRVRFKSEVVWCRPRDEHSYWVGIRFLEVQEQERQLIETYIGLVDRSKRQMRL